MIPRLMIIVTLLIGVQGCVTPSVEMPILDYKQPATHEVVITELKVSEDSVTMKAPNGVSVSASIPRTIVPVLKSFNLSQIKKVPDIGTGINRPEARIGDPWNIVLKRVRIETHGNWVSPGQIAILVRVITDGQGEDEPWILAALERNVAKGTKLNFENLVVWSGSLAQQNVVLEIKVLNLTKFDKDVVDKYASAAGQLSGLIPVYGSALKALAQFGTAINEARDDYEILLQYRKGFSVEAKPRYAAYALLPSQAFERWVNQLWFDDSTQDVMAGDGKLQANWLVISIAKSAARAFEYQKISSAQEILKIAGDWQNRDRDNAIKAIDDSVKKTKSAAEMQRILSTVEFDRPTSIISGINKFKDAYLGGPGISPTIDRQYGNGFVTVLRSYFPEEFMYGKDLDAESQFNEWMDALTSLKQDYTYDKLAYQWVKN